ncbi:MAG TPA: heme A synthase [Acidimicrobiaceae bacterium]|nr:heme A synthase [Acidimicrobiaceae bacterium]
MSRLTALVRRVRAEGFTPREFRTVAITALVLLSVIVVTGGAVRLSGSGLGCDDWPNCNNERFIDVSTGHAAVENINRLFTFLVGFGVLLAALAAWYRRPRRRDLVVYGLVMLIGVPAQGLVGAVVVWTDLHPAAVQWHFLLSMVLVAAAVMMLVRAGEPDGPRRIATVVPRVRRRVRLLAVWTSITVVLGTIVTNTGPHAGDEYAKRFWGIADVDASGERIFRVNGDALSWVSRVHGVVVWVTVAVAFSLLWTLRNLRKDRGMLDAPLTAWLLVAIVQGSVGYVQYSAGLPVGLVAVHLAGATTLVGITTWLWAATSTTAERAGDMVERVAGRTRRPRRGTSLGS